MKEKSFKTYIIFWLSESLSQLGSAMTSYALVLWIYRKTQSAMSMSLISFCSYLPYVIISIFAGAFIDRHKKKNIMLWSDSIAAGCTCMVAGLLCMNRLSVYHIYMINFISGCMNAFQSPASLVAIGMIVQKEKYEKASGLGSFSSAVLTIISPMMATFIFSFWGLKLILMIDLVTFLSAFTVLLFFIKIPEKIDEDAGMKESILAGCRQGIAYLYMHKGILYLILSMATANFFSRLGYENILPAMILARTGGSETSLGIVTGFIGAGGVVGGLLVSVIKFPQKKIKVIYFSTAFSFLAGDLMMALSRRTWMWCVSAVVTSLLIPFINAGVQAIIYNKIPKEIQGRVFAVRNALQYCTIPAGIILGGFLAEYIFEPFMKSGQTISGLLASIVGTGKGSGMALMFLCTGILGSLSSIGWYKKKEVQELEEKIK